MAAKSSAKMVSSNPAGGLAPSDSDLPQLSAPAIKHLRGSLTQALQAACDYDGMMSSEETLIAKVSSLDTVLMRARGASTVSRDDAERAYLTQAYGAAGARQQPVTISQLLDFAVDNVRSKLLSHRIQIRTVEVPLCLVPTERESPALVSGDGSFEPRKIDESRESEIIVMLLRHGICLDELRVYAGITPTNSFRKVPYRLIQIPRLMREVLVCCQYGERTFVGRNLMGPLFWATYSKEQLLTHPDVNWVYARERWLEALEQLLFTDNPLRERSHARAPSGLLATTAYRLTEEVILVNALRWASVNDWRLPTAHSGAIPWLPGQDWKPWDTALRNSSRDLPRANCRGLSHLLQIYGCKRAHADFPEVIQAAWKRVADGKPHGLTDSEASHGTLSVDFVITKALEWASTHDWALPLRSSGNIPGVQGDTWSSWNNALRANSRQLGVPNCKGLGDFFVMYGLRSGQRDRHEEIEAAWLRIQCGEAHGFVKEAALTLTEDLIIRTAVEFASNNDWRLPTDRMGRIPGLSGEAWSGWCWALRKRRRGLKRKKCRGLSHLLTLFGLNEGWTPNKPLLQAVWQRLQNGEPHGLREMDEILADLTEVALLAKAREWSLANDGKIPNAFSGAIPGWTFGWTTAARVVREGGGRLTQAYKNLAHFFRHHQFTSGKKGAAARGDQRVDLTNDLILTKAIEYAAERQWSLPTSKSGVLAGIPGHTWYDCEQAAKARLRFGRSGLWGLFEDYGVLRASTVRVRELKAVSARLQAGQPHGLTPGHYVFTEDLLLCKAIEWAAKHRWKLPVPDHSAIPGRFGDTWSMAGNALSNNLRGLIRPDCRGLVHLFCIFGLRRNERDDVPVIKRAWARLQAGKSHGLEEVRADVDNLSEELILTKAVEWAATHHWELPGRLDGAVPGLLGETWLRMTYALRDARRGLTRQNCPGIAALFRIYGLMRGYKTNVSVVKAAWENLQNGLPLGLSDAHGEQHQLTELTIIGRALQWAALHAWRLPSAASGAVADEDTDTWLSYDKALVARNRGLKRRGCRGLPHLFRLCGFKTGRVTNTAEVQQAFAATKVKGGLEAYLQARLYTRRSSGRDRGSVAN